MVIDYDMQQLVDLLHSTAGATLVIANDEIRVMFNRGARDLWETLNEDPSFLKESYVADKVIGKAAAALVIKGGVERVHTDVISLDAVRMLTDAGIPFEYSVTTEYIRNRAGDGRCPLDTLCADLTSVAQIIEAINKFMLQARP